MSLEAVISQDYFAFPWLHPINWAANFPFKKIGRTAKLQVRHKFTGKIKQKGKPAAVTARLREKREGLEGIFYSVAYQDTPKSLDPKWEIAEDTHREGTLNKDKWHYDRRAAMNIALMGDGIISVYQHDQPFWESWYALPLKIALAPLTILNSFRKGYKKIVNLGKMYEIEGTGVQGDVKLDQNFLGQLVTFGLGKYYSIYNSAGEKVANIKRSPLWKLLTLGLKDSFKIKLYHDNHRLADTAQGITDYLQHEWRFRFFEPKNHHIPTENVFRYGA